MGGEPEGAFCRWCRGVGVGMWQRVYFEGRVKDSPVELNRRTEGTWKIFEEKTPPSLFLLSPEQSMTSLCSWLLFAIAASEMQFDLT